MSQLRLWVLQQKADGALVLGDALMGRWSPTHLVENAFVSGGAT